MNDVTIEMVTSNKMGERGMRLTLQPHVAQMYLDRGVAKLVDDEPSVKSMDAPPADKSLKRDKARRKAG